MIQEEKKDVRKFDNDVYNRYLGAELSINRGDGEIRGRVVNERAVTTASLSAGRITIP